MSSIPYHQNPTQPDLLRAIPDASRDDLWRRFLRAAAKPHATPETVRNLVIRGLRSGLSRTHPDLARWRVLLVLLSRPRETLELARIAIAQVGKGVRHG